MIVPESSANVEERELKSFIDRYFHKALQAKPSVKAEWFSLLHSSKGEIQVRDVSSLIKQVHSEIRTSGLESIDRSLKDVELSLVAPEMLLGFLRGISVWRHSLTGWSSLLTKARRELSHRKLDPEKLLMGL